jgi:hypothetical protein
MRHCPWLLPAALASALLAGGCPGKLEPPASETSGDAQTPDAPRALDDTVADPDRGHSLPIPGERVEGDAYAADGEIDLGRRAFAAARRQEGGIGPAEQMLQEAITHFDKAVDLDPNLPEAYCGRGDVYLEIGRIWLTEDPGKSTGPLQHAVSDYSKAIELDSRNVPAYLGRGSVHEALGDPGFALADYEKVLELDPDSTEARSRMASLKDEMGLAD